MITYRSIMPTTDWDTSASTSARSKAHTTTWHYTVARDALRLEPRYGFYYYYFYATCMPVEQSPSSP